MISNTLISQSRQTCTFIMSCKFLGGIQAVENSLGMSQLKSVSLTRHLIICDRLNDESIATNYCSTRLRTRHGIGVNPTTTEDKTVEKSITQQYLWGNGVTETAGVSTNLYARNLQVNSSFVKIVAVCPHSFCMSLYLSI